MAHVWMGGTETSRFFFPETSCPQRSNGVQPSQKRLDYQPLWGA